MPLNDQDTRVYRTDVKTRGQTLSSAEREALIKKYLPALEEKKKLERKQSLANNQHRTSHRRRIRPFLSQKLYVLIYWVIQAIFGVYIRLRQIVSALFQKFIAIKHYHHRTPAYIKKDLKNLSRLPEHLSVILNHDPTDDAALEILLDEVAELSAWSAAAGIPLLSVYEKTGVLKQYMSALREIVQQKLVGYFGADPATPSLRVFAPNLPSLSPVQSPQLRPLQETNGHTENPGHLNLLLLSQTDGRETLVDLTRTLTEMSQSHKIRPRDITSELIDTEISATTAIPSSSPTPADSQSNLVNGYTEGSGSKVTCPTDPDLLIVFAPYVKLEGYPPWQLRLTEIFCVGDSGGDVSGRVRTRVEYQGFLRALWNYAGAQFRFGR